MAPGGIGSFLSINGAVEVNDLGQAIFAAVLEGAGGGGNQLSGIYRSQPSSADLRQVARIGNAPPGGDGSFGLFALPDFNNSGQAAFFGNLEGTSGGNADDRGIFLSDSSAMSITEIVREGRAAPDSNGFFSEQDDARSEEQHKNLQSQTSLTPVGAVRTKVRCCCRYQRSFAGVSPELALTSS